MARTNHVFQLCFVFSLILFVTGTAFAQYGASIQGTVTDKTGAVIAGATVTAINQATGVSRATVTGDSGLYRVSALTPGPYTVTVEAASFRKTTTKDVQVEAETVRGLNVTLQPGPAQETVTVTGETQGVQAENASVSEGITARQVEDLPQVGRDPFELLRLAPGVFGDGSRDSSGQALHLPNGAGPGGSNNSIFQVENQVQISANGQRVSGNNFTIDGVDVNSLTWGGASVVTPNQESISEVKVVSQSYSAEDGRNSGAQIKIISKSGSNQLHGSAFFKYGEPGLNAFNKFDGFINGFERAPTTRAENKSRSYGGSIGGPIFKNKLFFFFSYEGEHNNLGNLETGYVETPEFRQALSQLRPGSVSAAIVGAQGAVPAVKQYLGGACQDIIDWASNPGICSPIAAGSGTQGGLDLGSSVPITDPSDPYVPLSRAPTATGSSHIGNGLDGIPDVVQALLERPAHHYGNQYTARVDYHFGNHQLAASSYFTNADNLTIPNDQFRPMAAILNKPLDPAATLLWNWTISSTFLNEARLNFSRFNFDEVGTNTDVSFGIPESQIEGVFISGPRLDFGVRRSNNTPGVLSQNTYAFRDTVSKILGKHALKFGVEVRKEEDNNNEIGLARPVFSSVRLWNFFNSAPIFEGVDVNPQTGLPDSTQRYLRTSNYAFFGQTDWKVRPNLTLNLGLRYEYYTPISEKQDRLTNLVLGPIGDPNPTIQVINQLFPPDRNNIAPRIGFAWSPSKYENKIVFRGGLGVFFNRFEGAAFGPMRENPPFHASFGFCCGTSSEDFSTPFLNGLISYQMGASNSPLSFPGNPLLGVGTDPATNFPLTCQVIPNTPCNVQVYATPAKMPNPYTYVYSLETEYELPAKLNLTLGYQGSFGRKQLRIFDLNQVRDDLSSQLLAKPIFFIKPDVNSNFNSLNARAARRFANGFQFDAKYRWSKSLDHSSFGAPNAAANETFPRDLRTEYGPSDYDTTHYFVASSIWELPIFRGRHDFVGRALGGWQITGIFTARSGFPWTPTSGCGKTPGNEFICPFRPVAYTGGAGTDTSNDKLLTPGANFPGGGLSFFTVCDPGGPTLCVPAIGRNSFRGPRYQSVDMTFGKQTPFPFFFGEEAKLNFRANFFNIFNKLNLSPFGFNTSSTTIDSQYFGMATRGLSGRVIEFQARLSF